MSGFIPRNEDQHTFFLTLTVVDWVDVFTRPAYRQIFTDSLNYAVDNKGMELYAWVLMSNHAHLVASAKPAFRFLTFYGM